ncbi:hypothetical protein Q4S45_21445 [Massilia sp. R2A-15]|uniref:hypothetical protein n=1 Tax=Massilia sp. R2A-15 TaxID=3064278 RepID=UPI0027335E6F|nr:hypothetical protein [Massilia sp. R2A-15]WLI89229.1 hypothetical protein Q4S45_21445 [Massilia sp. R2A-15]
MDTVKYLAILERDGQVIAALQNSLEAMRLTHGARITMCGVSGTLNFEPQMLAIRDALSRLGVDPDESFSPEPSDIDPK